LKGISKHAMYNRTLELKFVHYLTNLLIFHSLALCLEREKGIKIEKKENEF